MSDLPPKTIADRIRLWSQVHKVADMKGLREVEKLAEVLKHTTRAEAFELVAGAQGRPMLCSYSNDGTPIRTTTRVVTSGSLGKVRRVGGAGHELLVQRAVFRTRGGTSGWQTVMMVRDPLPLVHGKGADAIFSASVEFLKTLRQMGHGGIAIQHYAFDRALHAPLVRRFKQHHARLASQQAPTATGPNALHQPALLEWVVDTACANHDAHNAMKWGMMGWMADTSLMKTAFIVIESLRNGFSELEKEISTWVVSVVHWVSSDELLDPMELTTLWGALGLEPKWADLLVELGLLWRGDRLLVHERHRGKDNIWTEIVNCLRHGLRFTQFSDSRWCTLGRACRQVLHAQLLGLNSLVKAALAHASTDYLLGGFKQLSPRVQQFLSTAAFASFPAESLLANLLEDDRVCVHYDEYRRGLSHEINTLIALPPLVWVLVSDLCSDLTPNMLRSQVLGSAHTSIGFIDDRVWTRCQDWPWKIAIGDLEKNIKDLVAMEAPPWESVSRKIWALGNQGYPREALLEGVRLLQHLGWTSTTVEQQHASATFVHRVHHTYGVQMLAARALLHTARLFYAVDPLDNEIRKMELKLQQQIDRTPRRAPGNAILFQKVMQLSEYRGGKAVHGARKQPVPRGRRQDRMARASVQLAQLSSKAQESLRAAAVLAEVEKAHRLTEESMATERSLLELKLKKKLKMMNDLPPKIIFSSCTFGKEQETHMMELFQSGAFSQGRVEKMRKNAVTHGLLQDHELKELDSMSILVKEKAKEPWWLSTVADCRSAFDGTAVVIGSGAEARFYKFLYAKKSPRSAVFCPLALEEPDPSEVLQLDYDGDQVSALQTWQYTFTCARLDIEEARVIDNDENSNVFVLCGLVDMGDTIISDGPLRVLSHFVQGMPEFDKKAQTRAVLGDKGRQSSEQKVEWQRLCSEHPWLGQKASRMDEKHQRKKAAGEEEADASDAQGDDSDESDLEEAIADVLDDEKLDFICTELEKMRQAFKDKFDHLVLPDFQAGLLGGASTYKATKSKKKDGVVSDFVICEVQTADGKSFLKSYGMQYSKRASIGIYGMGPATVMTEAWGHRMQYYLDLYRTSGDLSYAFTVADHNAYVEPPAVGGLVADADDSMREVMQSIRSCMPFYKMF